MAPRDPAGCLTAVPLSHVCSERTGAAVMDWEGQGGHGRGPVRGGSGPSHWVSCLDQQRCQLNGGGSKVGGGGRE